MIALGTGSMPLSRIGSLFLNEGEAGIRSAVIDTSESHAYFGSSTVVKILLRSGSWPPIRVGAAALHTGERSLFSAVIDPAGGQAYFGTSTSPGRVVKVELGNGSKPPARINAVVLNSGEGNIRSAVIDPVNGHAYFGAELDDTGHVVKIGLGSGSDPPTRIGAVTLINREDNLVCAVIDPLNEYAYFGVRYFTVSGRIVKIALGSGTDPPVRVGAVSLNNWERSAGSAVIDPESGYAYFGTQTSPARVVKVQLGDGSDPPVRVGAVTLNSAEDSLNCAVIDPANGFAYFGTSNAPAKIVKIDLGNGPDLPTRIGSATLASGENALQSAVIDQVDGFAYFGTMTSPGKIIKIELGTGLNPPTRIGAITLIDGEKNLTCAVIDSNSGHAYFGTNTTPGLVIRVGLSQKGFVKGTKFFLPEPGMVTDANFYSHAAAGNVRLAIYDTAPQPGLLWQSGSITNSVTEDWIRELISNGTPASLQLDAGDYWLAWQVDTSLPVPSYAQGDGR